MTVLVGFIVAYLVENTVDAVIILVERTLVDAVDDVLVDITNEELEMIVSSVKERMWQ